MGAEHQLSGEDLDNAIRAWCAEHARLGPFAYVPFIGKHNLEIPELWFPDKEPPWDEDTKREWLTRANEFMRRLDEARAAFTKDPTP